MQQHPVPQHIASYEFKLVGDMTLKQFLQVAGGGLVALLFYAAPLPVIIKWPFIFLFAVSGAALAFLPFEERPLSAWFVAFIRAIYSPTKYTYQEGKTLDIFAPETDQARAETQGEVYLSTPGIGEEPEIKKFEEEERNFFHKTLSMFHLSKGTPQTPAPVPQPAQQPPVQLSPITQPAPPPKPQVIVEEVKTNIPQNQPVSISAPAGPVQEAGINPQPLSDLVNIQTGGQVPPVFTPEPRRGPGRPRLTTPRFQIDANPPAAPRTPNIIVGQILDPVGNTVDSAILEIKDSEGRPVRALRSNRVGHFLTATPLLPGKYEVLIEKEGLEFEPIQISIGNEIMPPIEIKAKATNA